MNPMTNVKNVIRMNEKELMLGVAGSATSWHSEYKDSAWIFVGGLPYELTEGDIVCVFSQYGEIVNVNMIRDKDSGKFKGFGFICYEDQKSTILAVDNLNGVKILSRTIRVDHCKDYKVPKEHENEDDLTKQLRGQGCAPQEVVQCDDESAEETKEKKLKKEKKKKKKKHKVKKERRGSSEKESRRSSIDSPVMKGTSLKVEREVRVKSERHDPGYDKYLGRPGSPGARQVSRDRAEDKECSRTFHERQRYERLKYKSPDRDQRRRQESQDRDQRRRQESQDRDQRKRQESPDLGQRRRQESPDRDQGEHSQKRQRHNSSDNDQTRQMYHSPERKRQKLNSPDRDHRQRYDSQDHGRRQKLHSPDRNRRQDSTDRNRRQDSTDHNRRQDSPDQKRKRPRFDAAPNSDHHGQNQMLSGRQGRSSREISRERRQHAPYQQNSDRRQKEERRQRAPATPSSSDSGSSSSEQSDSSASSDSESDSSQGRTVKERRECNTSSRDTRR